MLAILAVLAAGFSVWWGGRTDGSSGPDGEAVCPPSPVQVPRIGERDPGPPPVERLRQLKELPLGKAPDFATVERWATRLSDEDLLALIEETGMEEHTGLTGWLRCALFAEWGRRDPEAALAYLHELGKPDPERNYARSQAAFSVYRGWSEKDPFAAKATIDYPSPSLLSARTLPDNRFPPQHEHLLALGLDDTARRKAREAAYEQIARQHPEQVLELLAGPDIDRDPTALRGLLHGSGPLLGSVVEAWEEQVWRDPSTLREIEAYHQNLNSHFSGLVLRPAVDEIAREIPLSLAEHDFDAALAWIEASDLGHEGDQIHRLFSFHDDWARLHPDLALDRIRMNTSPDRAKVLAYGALAGDPSLAVELVRQFDKPNDRWDVLFTAMSSASNHHVDDFYPAPGWPNPLRDFEANYRAILDAVAASELPADREADLLQRVNQEFSHQVPAAAEALR